MFLNKWTHELVITSYNHQSAFPQPNIGTPARASHLYKTVSDPPTHTVRLLTLILATFPLLFHLIIAFPRSSYNSAIKGTDYQYSDASSSGYCGVTLGNYLTSLCLAYKMGKMVTIGLL